VQALALADHQIVGACGIVYYSANAEVGPSCANDVGIDHLDALVVEIDRTHMQGLVDIASDVREDPESFLLSQVGATGRICRSSVTASQFRNRPSEICEHSAECL
jgi:hypothetical protein